MLIIIIFLFDLLRHAGTEILHFNTDTDGLLNIILPCTSRLSRRSTAKTGSDRQSDRLVATLGRFR